MSLKLPNGNAEYGQVSRGFFADSYARANALLLGQKAEISLVIWHLQKNLGATGVSGRYECKGLLFCG